MRPLRVLILDDEKDLCDMFSQCFVAEDVQIEAFTDPQRALQFVKNRAVDLIFIDYHLANVKGDIIAAQMPLQTPKVLLTGDLPKERLNQFAAIVQKPYEKQDILNIINSYKSLVSD